MDVTIVMVIIHMHTKYNENDLSKNEFVKWFEQMTNVLVFWKHTLNRI